MAQLLKVAINPIFKKIHMMKKHFNGKTFSIHNIKVKKSFWQFLKWKLFKNNKKKWPRFVKNNIKPHLPTHIDVNELSTTFINHATHLLQFQQLNIITDPVFSQRVSPVKFLGPKRIQPPGMIIAELPKIDVILISHNHYDHLDLASLQEIANRDNPLIILPIRNKKIIAEIPFKKIIELDWWQEFSWDKDTKITLVPAQHWSARTLWDANQSLWGGFVIETNQLKIYFSGDTGYGSHFKEIKNFFSSIHVSILPIGAYEPRWFMKEQHLNPEEAVLAHIDLNSQLSIASHHSTFQLTDEGMDEPRDELIKQLKNYAISTSQFLIPQNGESYFFKPFENKRNQSIS